MYITRKKEDYYQLLVTFQNIVAQKYHFRGDMSLLTREDISNEELELLALLLGDTNSAQNLIGYCFSPVLQRFDFHNVNKETIKLIKLVGSKNLFQKYFGLTYSPHGWALGEVIHAGSGIIGRIVEGAEAGQIFPSLSNPSYRNMFSHYLSKGMDIEGKILIAGAFSPMSIYDWADVIRGMGLLNPIDVIDLMDGIKPDFDYGPHVTFNKADVFEYRLEHDTRIVFTSSLTQHLITDGNLYGHHWNNDLVDARESLFEHLYDQLAPGAALIMVENALDDEDPMSDRSIIVQQLREIGFRSARVRRAQLITNWHKPVVKRQKGCFQICAIK